MCVIAVLIGCKRCGGWVFLSPVSVQAVGSHVTAAGLHLVFGQAVQSLATSCVMPRRPSIHAEPKGEARLKGRQGHRSGRLPLAAACRRNQLAGGAFAAARISRRLHRPGGRCLRTVQRFAILSLAEEIR